jgi:hypothetical protein
MIIMFAHWIDELELVRDWSCWSYVLFCLWRCLFFLFYYSCMSSNRGTHPFPGNLSLLGWMCPLVPCLPWHPLCYCFVSLSSKLKFKWNANLSEANLLTWGKDVNDMMSMSWNVISLGLIVCTCNHALVICKLLLIICKLLLLNLVLLIINSVLILGHWRVNISFSRLV